MEITFSGETIDGADLTAIQHQKQEIQDCSIINTRIRDSNFSHTAFIETLFENVAALHTCFDECRMEAEEMQCLDNTFLQCTMKNMEIKYISMESSEFIECNMTGMRLELAVYSQCILKYNDMQGVLFQESSISGNRVISNNFRKAKLLHGGFNHISRMTNNDFTDSEMNGFTWDNCSCQNNNLRDSRLSNVCSQQNYYCQCDYSRANLQNCCFQNDVFLDCVMENTIIKNAQFTGCDFENIDFSTVIYENVCFENCKFKNVNLSPEQKIDWGVQ